MLTGPSSATVCFERAIDLARVADVGRNRETTDFLRRGRRCLGVLLPDRHLRTEGGEAVRDAAADTGTAAGNDGDAVCQEHCRWVKGHAATLQ